MVDLDTLEKALAEATAGPWRCGRVWTDCVMVPYESGLAGPGGERVLLRMNNNSTAFPFEADARLICALRNAAPELIAEIRRLRWYEEQWREMQDGAKPSE